MAEVAIHPEVLKNRVAAALGEKAKRLTIDHGEPVSYTHLTLPTILLV